MNRLKTLPIAAMLMVAAPLPALAQAWPATVVAGAPRAASAPAAAPRSAIVTPHGLMRHDPRAIRRAPGVPPTDPASRTLNLTHAGEIPEVDLRPKAAWSDDEGWRASPTRVAFKHRF